MSWLRIDDGMVLHHKVKPLSDGAFRAHVEALSHCARAETDGIITTALAKSSGWAKRTAELEAARLWEVVEGGWLIHNYLTYNPSRAQLEEKREAARVRMNKARRSREHDANFAVRSPNPIPSHPIPSPDQTHTQARVVSFVLTTEQRGVVDALHDQVHRLVYGGAGYPDPGWCEDLIRRGATLTDVSHAIQNTISRGKRSAAYVRAILEGRVQEREQGRDPDAVSAGPSSLESGSYAGKGRARAVAPTGDGAHFSNTPPEA